MKKERIAFLYVGILIFLMIFSINPAFATDDIIRSMDDFNSSSQNYSTLFSGLSVNKSDSIIVLYNESDENNIGSLGLKRDDFKAGESLDSRIDVLETSGKTSTDVLINQIEKSEKVAAVDYDVNVEITDVNDALYAANQKDIFKQVGADKTLMLGQSQLVKVAVLDTGLYFDHEDIQGRYLNEGYNYQADNFNCSDDNGHGTAVAGVISALTNNTYGVAGFAGTNNVKVVPYKVLDQNGEGRLSVITKALRDMENTDIKLINLSFGIDKHNAVLEQVVNECYLNGKIIIASSGNIGDSHLFYPAACEYVISVGAIDINNLRCTSKSWGTNRGSNYGIGLDFMAPGNQLPTLGTKGRNSYSMSSGTSFSSPVVTSLISILLQAKPDLSFHDIMNILRESSVDLGNPGYDYEYGNGKIDFSKAYALVTGKEPEQNPNNGFLTNSPSTNTNPSDTIKPPSNSLQSPPNNQRPSNGIQEGTKLTITPAVLRLVKNQVTSLSVETNSDKKVVWSSSNPAVASVNSNGQVRALQTGSTIIRAGFTDTDYLAQADVIVLDSVILSISALSQNVGWIPSVPSTQIAGTTGRNLQLEALIINTADPKVNVQTQVHVTNIGDMNPVETGEVAGTTGKSLGIEALKLNLTGANASNYKIFYRTHVENFGWTNWATANEWCGSKGHNCQLEAIQIYITDSLGQVPNGSSNVSWKLLN